MAGIAVAPDEAGVAERLRRWPAAASRRRSSSAWATASSPARPAGVDRLRELEAAGVERVFLQHLNHEDLETVELIGRELVPDAWARRTDGSGRAAPCSREGVPVR